MSVVVVAAAVTGARAAVVGIDVSAIGGINGGIASGTRTLIADWPAAGAGMLWISNGFGGFETGLGGFGGLEFAIGNPMAYANPRNFSPASSIDATATWAAGTAFSAFQQGGSLSSDFDAGSYMGFRFGSGSTWRYGYVEVIWSFATRVFSIRSAAFESSANAMILAGASPVPAPGAIALLGLAGLAGRRRVR